jgi:methylisocitrate lyase
MRNSPGFHFQQAAAQEKPLQIVGTIHAFTAIMAKRVGFKAIYLSGAGVANLSYGWPDLGITTLDNVLCEARKITDAVDLPLLVDVDTGWGNALMIERTVKSMEKAGVAAIHIEDQAFEKRCGHRPGKMIVPTEEMVDRIKAAVNARRDKHFIVMARTDAYASEGIEKMIERCQAYEEAGADMLFLEALTALNEYQRCKKNLAKPILANITEFGHTPLFTLKELASVGVDLVLYPLSASRAMNLAALNIFQELRTHGTQQHVLDRMQTREELYGFLNYQEFEARIDQISQQDKQQ